MMPLYHFTCSHGRDGIDASGVIRPVHQPFLGVDLAWFTDDATLGYHDLGLQSSVLLTCDRMEFRYRVTRRSSIVRWDIWAAVHRIPFGTVSALNAGRKHTSWWVSEVRVPIESVSQDRPPHVHHREALAPCAPSTSPIRPGAQGGGRT